MVAKLSNSQSIKDFTDELLAYEAQVIPGSDSFEDFKIPATLLKEPLLRLITASSSDTISMMRKLTARVAGQMDGAYSEYVMTMISVSTGHELTKQLINAILNNLRELILGRTIDINNQEWFDAANGNEAIRTFMNGYVAQNTTIIVETPTDDDDNVTGGGGIKNIVHNAGLQSDYEIEVGNDSYVVNLELNEQQTISFVPSSSPSTIINSSVTVSSNIGWFAIDKTISFSNDVQLQMDDLRCLPNGIVNNTDTIVKLPGLFYSMVFQVISTDLGSNWTIVEVNIIPKEIS